MNNSIDSVALILQLCTCAFMAGVISVIQLIHYPSFGDIDPAHFKRFHSQHLKALGFIAGPMMVVEFLSALWLAKSGNLGWILNLIAVFILWLLTFFVSVPIHNLLAAGFHENSWRKLVSTNWPRFALWCSRMLILSVFLATSTGAPL